MAYPNMDMKIPRAREDNLIDSDDMATPTQSSSENNSANTNVTDDRIVARMDVGPEEDDGDRDAVQCCSSDCAQEMEGN